MAEDETPETAPSDEEERGSTTPKTFKNPASRDSDRVERSGFRNPPNARTKAQKKKRRKKK